MSLAWKNDQRSDASMFFVLASFCAPLPSVSEKARNNARIAITSAILGLKPSPTSIFSPSLAFSMASLISDMMAPVLLFGLDGLAQGVTLCNRCAADFVRLAAYAASDDLDHARGCAER